MPILCERSQDPDFRDFEPLLDLDFLSDEDCISFSSNFFCDSCNVMSTCAIFITCWRIPFNFGRYRRPSHLVTIWPNSGLANFQ